MRLIILKSSLIFVRQLILNTYEINNTTSSSGVLVSSHWAAPGADLQAGHHGCHQQPWVQDWLPPQGECTAWVQCHGQMQERNKLGQSLQPDFIQCNTRCNSTDDKVSKLSPLGIALS